MNPKEYIESGKLESYILGSCTSEEMQEVECMARVFPEVHQELETIRAAFESYAIANQVAPSANLKSKIFDAIEELETTGNAPDTIALPSAKIINLPKNSTNGGAGIKLLMAASLALLIVSAFFAYTLYRENQKLSASLENLATDQEKLQAGVMDLQQKLQNSRNELLVISDTNSIPVTMKGLPLSPQSLATVYWNKQSKEVYLAVNELPLPPEGKQYQLWAIVAGAPVDLGVFEIVSTGDSLLQKMKTVDNAAAFAVTLETRGGSSSPTLEQMYVVGNI